uniref:Pyruvate decarboxylase family protein n=1 Tax=Arundo donax TaxID=35708 RepID=A0A0A9F5R3_ARUDO
MRSGQALAVAWESPARPWTPPGPETVRRRAGVPVRKP